MPKVSTKTEMKKTVVKKASAKVTKEKVIKEVSLTVPMFSLEGKEAGTLELSKDIFGAKVNQQLLAQALRVYMNNLKAHWSNTKTRGEVEGSSRKIRAQKGTGGARHGTVRAPIFVGGGIALGPKFRKTVLDLPKKMKRAALISALSMKTSQGEVVGVAGLDKASGKTVEMEKFFSALNKKNILLVVDGKNEKLSAAVKNIEEMHLLSFEQLNTLKVVQHQIVIFTKEAAEKLAIRTTNGVKEGEKA